MPFDVDQHCNTFKFRFWAVYTQANGGTGAIAPEYAAAKRGHHRFFFLVREKGGSSAPSEPPLATCLRVHGLAYNYARNAKQNYAGNMVHICSSFHIVSQFSTLVGKSLINIWFYSCSHYSRRFDYSCCGERIIRFTQNEYSFHPYIYVSAPGP